LENRLDKANQRFNDLIAQNKKTREEIDNIRKEKAIFEGVYSKLEK
jgi:coiled-coil domain-containing protein 63/114